MLQYLGPEDVASLKRCSRLTYNVCSQYFRTKPVSDLATELFNSEAVFNVFLKSFLSDYRDVIASSCPGVDLTPVFGPVEKICSLSTKMLSLLGTALETDTLSTGEVASVFLSEIGGEDAKMLKFFCLFFFFSNPQKRY